VFKDELDALKKVNQLCEELEIPQKNPTISAITNHEYQKKEKISQYKGVTWNKNRKKWYVQLRLVKGGKQKYGGMFKNEVDGARRVNQLCQELGIPPQNPTINAIPHQRYQAKEKTSQYKGVYWHKNTRKWCAFVYLKGQTDQKYCGGFDNELDAAKKVNELCQTFGIPLQNPEISAIPNQQYQAKEKTSQYKGVYWHKKRKKWRASVYLKEQKKYCGEFDDELDAAKKVNELCQTFGIPLQNPGVVEMPTQASPDDVFQNIENPVISVGILKTDDDDTNTMKRKHEKKFNDDDKLPVERNYFFYDYLLK
jgi:hypothetical protein